MRASRRAAVRLDCASVAVTEQRIKEGHQVLPGHQREATVDRVGADGARPPHPRGHPYSTDVTRHPAIVRVPHPRRGGRDLPGEITADKDSAVAEPFQVPGDIVRAHAVLNRQIRGIEDVEHLEPFNVVRAFGVWDDEHRDAFAAWCEAPFYP